MIMSGKRKANGKDLAKQKREKYELKQKRNLERKQSNDSQRELAAQYSSFVTWLDIDDVKQVRQLLLMQRKNNQERSANYDDNKNLESYKQCLPLEGRGIHSHRVNKLYDMIYPFIDLKENNKNVDEHKDSRGRKIFITEGTETVRLLIQKCQGSCHDIFNHDYQHDNINHDYQHDVVSILTKPNTSFNEPVCLIETVKQSFPDYFSIDGKDQLDQTNPFPFHVFIGTEQVLTDIAGFNITRGALGCGYTPTKYDENWLHSYLEKKIISYGPPTRNTRILAIDSISDTANLGSLIRSSAAFDIDCVVLSDDSCDAWYRRSVRVSMGHILSVPSVRVKDLALTISALKTKFGITSYAAVVDTAVDLVLENIPKGGINQHWCCVLGNESNGISAKVINACSSCIRIGMTASVDSLSIGIAGGILLHGLREREMKATKFINNFDEMSG